MKRYYYIVWHTRFYPQNATGSLIDQHPADWLAGHLEDVKSGVRQQPPVIINQFEITADQYQKLEALQ